MTYLCQLHVCQNRFWHNSYPEDLEENEIVPFNAQRDALSPYWWIPNIDSHGKSRWRSRRQLKNMTAYISSSEFKNDYEKWLKTNFLKIATKDTECS